MLKIKKSGKGNITDCDNEGFCGLKRFTSANE